MAANGIVLLALFIVGVVLVGTGRWPATWASMLGQLTLAGGGNAGTNAPALPAAPTVTQAPGGEVNLNL